MNELRGTKRWDEKEGQLRLKAALKQCRMSGKREIKRCWPYTEKKGQGALQETKVVSRKKKDRGLTEVKNLKYSQIYRRVEHRLQQAKRSTGEDR